MLTAAEQALSTALAVIPFPALPAVRARDMAAGLRHAHNDPPNLTRPNPVPVPLPSAGPVSYLRLDLSLYSLLRPRSRELASIYSTGPDRPLTFNEVIEDDAFHVACVAYLERHGAPIFTDVRQHDRCLDAPEAGLKQGDDPATALARAQLAVSIGESPKVAAST